jgi:hypothetical protein
VLVGASNKLPLPATFHNFHRRPGLTVGVIDVVYRLATQAEKTKNQPALYGSAALPSIQGSEKLNLLDEGMVPTS